MHPIHRGITKYAILRIISNSMALRIFIWPSCCFFRFSLVVIIYTPVTLCLRPQLFKLLLLAFFTTYPTSAENPKNLLTRKDCLYKMEAPRSIPPLRGLLLSRCFSADEENREGKPRRPFKYLKVLQFPGFCIFILVQNLRRSLYAELHFGQRLPVVWSIFLFNSIDTMLNNVKGLFQENYD